VTAAKPAGRSRVASAQFRSALPRTPRAEARELHFTRFDLMAIFQSSLGIDLRGDRIVFSSLRKSFNQVWVNTSQTFPLSTEKPKDEREAELLNTIEGL